MKTLLITLITAVLILPAVSLVARADVNVGLSADDNGIREFHLAIGDYYHVPEKEIVVVHERSIPDDDLPVVFFIAQRARISPDAIVDLRLKGDSWMDITLHFGLSPEIYYIPVQDVSGPPYGKAYGYYKDRPRNEWVKIRLGDDDIVNLVNLRFISEHYGYSPDRVIRYRSRGDDFYRIHDDFKSEKAGKGHDEVTRDNHNRDENRGGNKDENKGNGNQGDKQDKGKGRGRDK